MKTALFTIKALIVFQLITGVGLWASALCNDDFRSFAHMVLLTLYVG